MLVTIPACLHQHDPHLLYTLSAIQVAVILDRLDMLDLERIEDFICGLQQDDGSFVGDAWKEVDTRVSFCAVAALSLMGKLETADIDLDKVWSLTQFYSVDISQSRIGVNKCVFYKRTIKVCVSCC